MLLAVELLLDALLHNLNLWLHPGDADTLRQVDIGVRLADGDALGEAVVALGRGRGRGQAGHRGDDEAALVHLPPGPRIVLASSVVHHRTSATSRGFGQDISVDGCPGARTAPAPRPAPAAPPTGHLLAHAHLRLLLGEHPLLPPLLLLHVEPLRAPLVSLLLVLRKQSPVICHCFGNISEGKIRLLLGELTPVFGTEN